MQEDLKKTLTDFFGINGDNRRFFDATQIPRICNDIATIKKHIEEIKDIIKDKQKDHEERIRSLEYKQAYWAGGAAIVAALLTLFLQKVF